MSNPVLAVLAGAGFTAIVQSSSATTGIVIVLAGNGLITLESGIGLILGANVGTCVTAFVSSLGRPREAMQAAWAHIIFNVAGVLIWVLLIGQLADLVRGISPVSEGLAGLERLAADTPRQIANAHTLFNLANLAIFIWFTPLLARLVERIVPPVPAPAGVRPLFLDDFFLNESATALDIVRRELGHVAERVAGMLRLSLRTTLHGSERDAQALIDADNEVDSLYREVIRYLGKLSQNDLVGRQPTLLNDFVGIANYLENTGDVVEKDLLPVAAKRRRLNIRVSPETEAKLDELARIVVENFDKAAQTILTGDTELALEVLDSKSAVRDLCEETAAQIASRLADEREYRVDTFQIETEIIEIYRRFNTLSRRIARLTVDAGQVEAPESEAAA
jgi:phosphate:Na+ symporter